MSFLRSANTLMHLKNSVALVAIAGLVGCSGGGGSGTTARPISTPTTPPAPVPTPQGQSFGLEGSATMGLVLGGTVIVSDPLSGAQLATGSTSFVDGSYGVFVPESANFNGAFVRVTVQGDADAVMICDAAPGCGGSIAFGDRFPIDSTVSLQAIIETPEPGTTRALHLSPLTDLAARLAELNETGLSASSLAAANSTMPTSSD